MILRTISAAALALALHAVPAAAQAQPEADKSFRAFLDQLWLDAKAKDIKRSTFDAAFAGVTPDPRVMPITKRQPEYIKPAGA
jgi:membrane-bound lytic murein transglycosylase B